MSEKKSNTLVHDTIAIFIITLVAGVLLGGVYQMTKDTIAQREADATNEAYAAVYQDASFEETEELTKAKEAFNEDLKSGKIESVSGYSLTDVEITDIRAADKGGYVLTTSGKGYGGAVKIALGVNDAGEIIGIQITDCTNETPGLGQNSTKEDWNGQYKSASTAKEAVVNKDKESAKGDVVEINAISGATITSRAVTRAVNGAMLLISSLAK